MKTLCELCPLRQKCEEQGGDMHPCGSGAPSYKWKVWHGMEEEPPTDKIIALAGHREEVLWTSAGVLVKDGVRGVFVDVPYGYYGLYVPRSYFAWTDFSEIRYKAEKG